MVLTVMYVPSLLDTGWAQGRKLPRALASQRVEFSWANVQHKPLFRCFCFGRAVARLGEQITPFN